MSGYYLVIEITMKAPRVANVGHRKSNQLKSVRHWGLQVQDNWLTPFQCTDLGGVSNQFNYATHSQIPSLFPHVDREGKRLEVGLEP